MQPGREWHETLCSGASGLGGGSHLGNVFFGRDLSKESVTMSPPLLGKTILTFIEEKRVWAGDGHKDWAVMASSRT